MKFHISFFLILYIVFFKNTIKSETTTDESATGSLSSDGSRVTTQARIEKPKEQPALPTLAQETQPQQQQQQKEVGSGIGAEQKVESAKPGVEVSQSDVERAGRSSGTGGSVGTKISPGSQGQGKVAGPQLPRLPQLPQLPQSFEQSRNQQSSPVTPKRNGISPTNAKSPESVLPPAQSFTNLNKSTIPHTIPIKSSFLKYYKGVKITGSCGVQFQLVIVPHLFIYVETKENNIQLEPRFMKLNERIDFEKDKSNLKNKCDVNKKQSFKFILYLQHDLITIKWKVYEEKPDTTTRIAPGQVDLNVDVKRYKLPKLDQPVISIQIHSLAQDGETYLMESKDYNLEDQIPEKCEAIASDCFLSGNVDIEKCLQCTLLVIKADKNDECLKYVSKNVKDRFEEILTKGEDDEDSDEYDFIASANYILKNIYKKNDTNGKKELLHFKDINNNLKLELINYCNLLKDNDVSGILTYEKLGNVQDIFNNLTKLLEEHKEENNYVLYHKMKNEVLCLKNANDWMKNKTGLVLPQLKYSLNKFNKNKENYIKENIFEEDENGIVDLTKFPIDTNYLSYKHIDHTYCNNDYCNWSKDKNSCISKINVEDQKNCALSWAFASIYHLETIKCMKGYEPLNASVLYVTNCLKNKNNDVCTEGSNPLVFLETIEEKGFLPTESNYPYDQSKVGDVCPQVQNDWDNVFENTKVLEYNNAPFSVGTKGYIAYESEVFQKDIDSFVKLIKDEIMNKGSVIAYVKAKNVLGYELNGKKVQNLCGDKKPDHAVNIVGYGNYINNKGEKKSYWIVRNSWGKYWGDEGYFKVDMYGPPTCEDNFIHTVVVFNVEVPVNENFDKKEHDIYKSYLKNSPDFYHNIYYKNYNFENYVSPISTWSEVLHNTLYNNNLIWGQETTDPIGEGKLPASEAGHLRGEGKGNSEENQGQRSNANGAISSNQSTGGKITKQGESKDDGVALPVSTDGKPNTSSSVVDTNDQRSLPNPRATSLQPPSVQIPNHEGTSAPGNSRTPSIVSPTAAEKSRKAQIFHVLKHIKNSRIKMGLVKYDNSDNIGGDHVCSRTYAVNPEKQEECVKFCEENWENCKNKPSPGYCLAKLKNTNECFFCYV
uniref:Putative papain-like cysteine prorease n=1 Tax=Plasmodium falciparum TaxID=5833 RepID=A0A0E4B1V4_PLAFA|nr:putative papain-like cysteine prorease [Plasmodium falciparum]